MDKADWLACRDPQQMLAYLNQAPNASRRKQVLFCCAVCRLSWALIEDERLRKAVEVCERSADGKASGDELQAASDGAHEARRKLSRIEGEVRNAHGAVAVAWRTVKRVSEYLNSEKESQALAGARRAAQHAAERAEKLDLRLAESLAARAAANTVCICAGRTIFSARFEWPIWATFLRDIQSYAASQGSTVAEETLEEHCELLRHLFPCFDELPVLSMPPNIVALAAAHYDQQNMSFALHDALLEAGHDDLAAHFREPYHPKGCWALDLILGKK